MSARVILSLGSERREDQAPFPPSLSSPMLPPDTENPLVASGGGDGLVSPPPPQSPTPISCLETSWTPPCTKLFCFFSVPVPTQIWDIAFFPLIPASLPHPHEVPNCNRTQTMVSRSLATLHSKQQPVAEQEVVFLSPALAHLPPPPLQLPRLPPLAVA